VVVLVIGVCGVAAFLQHRKRKAQQARLLEEQREREPPVNHKGSVYTSYESAGVGRKTSVAGVIPSPIHSTKLPFQGGRSEAFDDVPEAQHQAARPSEGNGNQPSAAGSSLRFVSHSALDHEMDQEL